MISVQFIVYNYPVYFVVLATLMTEKLFYFYLLFCIVIKHYTDIMAIMQYAIYMHF